LNEFGESKQKKMDHDCCIICHAQCSCSDSGCQVEQPSFLSDTSQQQRERKTMKVSKQHKEELRELLADYQKQLEKSCPAYFKCMSSQSTTGFSNALIKSVLKNLMGIFCLEDLLELTPVYKTSHAVDIMFMIKDVCEDFELNMDFDYEFGGQYDLDDFSSDRDSYVASMASAMSGLMEL